jgi:predicted P-loop ATPase
VAARLLPSSVSVTWPGGDNGEAHVDWFPLAGRRVTLWMDADDSGRACGERIAERLQAMGCGLRSLDTDGQPKGWDIADAVADGWDRARVVAFARERVRPWEPKNEAPEAGDIGGSGDAAPSSDSRGGGERLARAASGDDVRGETQAVACEYAGTRADDAIPGPDFVPAIDGELITDIKPASASAITVSWATLGLACNDSGQPHANLDNFCRVLSGHPEFLGRIYYDEFRQRVCSTWGARSEYEWTDADDSRLTLWIQRACGIRNAKTSTVAEAVSVIARQNARNPCKEWLQGLRWDGFDRLSRLLPEAFGTPDDDYHAAVGRCWLVSMVRRVLDPGCKVDTMPVFEGAQGIRKSTAMQTLCGAAWFAEAAESPTSKDFHLGLVGKMLVEIAEMDSFSKTDVDKIKQVISCRVDRYRKPYGRHSEDHPRSCVFAGTVNGDDWNRDHTGARRFWPVACARADVDWIESNREQLFAEAVARAARGEPHWDVPDDEAKRLQESRRASDEWETVIADWLVGQHEVRATDVLTTALNVPVERQDKAAQMRVGKALRVLGWTRIVRRQGPILARVWVRDAGLEL